jgi:hypothetical protein
LVEDLEPEEVLDEPDEELDELVVPLVGADGGAVPPSSIVTPITPPRLL